MRAVTRCPTRRLAGSSTTVATGLDAFVEAPKPGNHRATLTVKTRDGSVETSVAFTTVELPEERDED